ncbi:MAG: cobalt-precorrin-5B (C(1))-methyltransferase [Methanotrichaceae archaeon]
MSTTDPVTGFEIPDSWIAHAEPNALEKIRSGLWVILSGGRMLRRGLTTGTTAAAACKGAILSLVKDVKVVDVMTPAGIRVSIPVAASGGICSAFKKGGDHQFDVTSGIEIIAAASHSGKTELVAGKGIGRISGNSLPVGHAAISQSARKQIMEAIIEGLACTGLKDVKVELSVPRGVEVAMKTLNPKLGIEGGISILGSTGFVEPWNEHLVESRIEELKGIEKVLATTGRTGLKYSRILFPEHKAVLIGSQLHHLEFVKDQDSILCGLPALILKWAWPEVLDGTGYNTIAEMVEREPEHQNISIALQKARALLPFTRIVLLQRDGKIFKDVR